MVFLTRREHFNAAHKLYNAGWSAEKNDEVFGKCANANWHGHNYEVFVTVKGEPNPDTGFVINAKELSDIIKKYVCDKLDHKNLNLDVDFMQGQFTSTENLAKAIWQQLVPHIKDCALHCVKVQETENIYVEYFGN
jgi:6-pyruvoyltetrahydropterin/6-carboxytetrahydropterin synthase